MGSGEISGVLRRSWPSSQLTSRPVLFTGESGLGKSTLINSLFLTNLYEDRQVPDASGKICPPPPLRAPHSHRLLTPTGSPPLQAPHSYRLPTLLLSWSSLCGVPGLFLCHQTAFFFFWSGALGGHWFSLRRFPPLERSPASEPYTASFSTPTARTTQTLTIERRGVDIEEGGIKVKLTLVDTPGFGDSVDCSDW